MPARCVTLLLVLCACGGEDDAEPTNPGVSVPDMGQALPDGGNTSDAASSPPSESPDGGAVAHDAAAEPVDADTTADTFFRADTIVLAAPKLVAKPVLLPEQDITGQGQGVLDDAITLDGDHDGNIDLSLLIRFLGTATPNAGAGTVTTGGGTCADPLGDLPVCGSDPTFPFQDPGVHYENGQDCQLEGVQDSAIGACFLTEKASLTMTLPILGKVPLRDAQVMGSWEAATIVRGHVRGFLPKSVAQATHLPDVLPAYLTALTIQPGTPLTDFLSDEEQKPDATGEQGWWFSVSFTARPARFE